jgi:hypothetical protein
MPQTYYRDPAVRARVREFLGATAKGPASAAFVVALDSSGRFPFTWDVCRPRPSSDLSAALERGADLSRSLWDAEHLLFFLDLDHLDADEPAEPFVNPAAVFAKLEPAYQAVLRVFDAAGLQSSVSMTGRGYHFVGSIPLHSPLVDTLADLLPGPPPWFATHGTRRAPGIAIALTERHARAAHGLGVILEFAAHRIAAEAASSSAIPVVFNGTTVGRGGHGRECVSIDFSHAGDPLDIRHMRTALSTYQWHRLRPDIFGEGGARVPPLVVLPRNPGEPVPPLEQRGLAAGIEAARATTGVILDVSAGVAELAVRYRRSPLAAFHRAFYAERGMPVATPRRLPPGKAPPCVAAPLARPNDLLLKPEFIQHVVRHLMSRGWSAAEIAALVQRKYETDFGWGPRWTRMDPRTRAEFDVRVFAGLVATGEDALIDFNCVSAQEKHLCPRRGCPYDLRDDRDRLTAARP